MSRLLLCSFGFVALPLVAAAAAPGTADPSTSERLTAAAERNGLRPAVLELALKAHARATAEGKTTSPILTVIDYSRLSREKRLWVLDVSRGVVLEHELVAHGRNTGGDESERFSNRAGSLQSSLGTFITGAIYHGKHGLSLRLEGLDASNDQAMARAIVLHGADYVNPGIVSQLGRLGRSQGCPAVSRSAAPRVIRLIKGGTVLFAYHPAITAVS
ncbi:MAG TPA: murein L,D-transpeptidase catalytic domain family protein [Gemmatimonadales bacterium]|nr:murein L,D-transpeptidase catalytic domain family protein [Gemmatimonadales bacterium]